MEVLCFVLGEVAFACIAGVIAWCLIELDNRKKKR